MIHAERPVGLVAAAQNCATYGLLSVRAGAGDVRRGALRGGSRLAVVEEGLSHREASRWFGIDRRTMKKMLSYSAPPEYGRSKPVRRPKLPGWTDERFVFALVVLSRTLFDLRFPGLFRAVDG